MSRDTRQQLTDSFMELLQHKPLSKITVSDIARGCGVSRVTFYYHFRDIYDLLENIFRETGREAFLQHPHSDTWQAVFFALCSLVVEHQEFVLTVFRQVDRVQIENFLYQYIRELVVLVIDEQIHGMELHPDDRKILTNFYTYAFTGLTLDWLSHGLRETPEELTNGVSAIVSGHIRESVARFRGNRVWAGPPGSFR